MTESPEVKSKPTYGDIYEADQAFRKLSQQNLAPKVAYRVAKLLKKITPEMKLIDKLRMEIFKKYGSEDGKGGYIVPDDKKDDFLKEQETLFSIESNLPFEPISVDSLANSMMSAADMLRLDKFLVD